MSGPGRQLDDDLVEAEVAIDRKDQFVDLVAFFGELLLGAEDMGVVLGEGAHPHEAVQRARGLVAVHRAELGEPQRQLAIAAQAVLEDHDVARAVHRLDRINALVLAFRLLAGGARHEHALAVPAPVARNLPQPLVEHLWRVHLLIIVGEPPAHVGDQDLEQRPSLGMPEDRAGTLLLEVEKVHFAGELAVVAPLGFLELLEVGVELLLPGEGGRVDARQHRLLRIAPPVGAGDLHQLERLSHLAGRGHVRPAAEIRPFPLAVELDVVARRNGVDELDLEGLALSFEETLRLVARDDCLPERLVARDDLAHAFLDRREILGRERLGAVEVVVEPVLDHRADRHLGVGPQRLHRIRQHMRRVVTDQFERARIVAGDEFEARVLPDRVGEVDEFAVADRRDRALGERGGDRPGDVEAGDAGLVGAPRAVGKGDV